MRLAISWGWDLWVCSLISTSLVETDKGKYNENVRKYLKNNKYLIEDALILKVINHVREIEWRMPANYNFFLMPSMHWCSLPYHCDARAKSIEKWSAHVSLRMWSKLEEPPDEDIYATTYTVEFNSWWKSKMDNSEKRSSSRLMWVHMLMRSQLKYAKNREKYLTNVANFLWVNFETWSCRRLTNVFKKCCFRDR